MTARNIVVPLLALMLLGNSRALDSTIATRRFAGVVLVSDGARTIYERNSGRRGEGAGATWRWASVTKQLTALIVMQEVAAGRLALDQPVKSYWPEWPHVYSDLITVRMLLQHDSGLADPAEDEQDADGVPHFYRSAAADPAKSAVGFCADHPRAEPGTGFHYNNCDFIVLGALLEHITGKPFATLLRERIGAPLGLPSIGLFSFGAPEQAHVRARGEVKVVLGTYGAAGGAYGSPRALLAFDRALMNHRLLAPEPSAEMWRGDPKLGQAALGAWSFAAKLAGCKEPVALVERRGEIGGVQVRNFLAPARGMAIAAFTHQTGIDFGEVWQGRGLSFDLVSAALCGGSPK